MVAVYLFEAKGLQGFVFETSKLKEIVGGSELLLQLTDPSDPDGAEDDSLLGKLCRVIGSDELDFSRRASGAVYVSSINLPQIECFREAWPLAARQFLPGIEIVQGYAVDPDYHRATEAARKQMLAMRHAPVAEMPPFMPLMLRNQRTARAAVRFGHEPDVEGDSGQTPLDQLCFLKREKAQSKGVSLRCLAPEFREKFLFPVNLDAVEGKDDARNRAQATFPFVGDSRLIGIVHADGTGLGALLKKLGETLRHADAKKSAAAYSAVSKILRDAGVQAARKASEVLIEEACGRSDLGNVLAARPIILGGEDFSAIVRADLAIRYTANFLSTFQSASKGLIAAAKNEAFEGIDIGIDQFTACAAVVFVNASQPFTRAHLLAESMVQRLKSYLKGKGLEGKTSALSFYRDTSGVETSISDVFDDVSVCMDGTTLEPMMPGYWVCGVKHGELPALHSLIQLASSRTLPTGPLRELQGLLSSSPDQARLRYSRIAEVMKKRNGLDLGTFFNQIATGNSPHPSVPIFFSTGEPGAPYICPLLDLQTMIALTTQEEDHV